MSRGRKFFLSVLYKKGWFNTWEVHPLSFTAFFLYSYLAAPRLSLSVAGYSLDGGYGFLLEVALLVGVHRIESPGSAVGAQVGALKHMGSSRTRDRTHGPCMGRQLLHHWTTREGLGGGASDCLEAHLLPSSVIPAPEAGWY